MAIITYLDTNCIIALADEETGRFSKVLALLADERRAFIYSPFITLETLSISLHYRQAERERLFRWYIRRCLYASDDLPQILHEAHRQTERYGIVGIDACHVAAAIVGSADEFYSFERPTKPVYRTKGVKAFSLL